MYTVQPVCRRVIISLWVASLVAVRLLTGDILTLVFFFASGIWLWLYLGNLKITLSSHCLVKNTGNIFKRKSIVLLKNIYQLQIFVLTPWLPAVIRIYTCGHTVFILGLNGRQVQMIENAVLSANNY